MVDVNRCPDCGKPVPASSPDTLCPQCLLKVDLQSVSVSGSESDVTTKYADELAASDPARRIGPYRVLQKLDEGGMGEVWLAEQEEPVRRRVALKLIKEGMDTKQVIARFESERQALAMMNHPNIARVFDAGATEQGRPYFAMEYVEGEPITRYCDRHRLGVRERLELFMHVCGGVQHAHQKGIIHRDIKPSNVLVRVQDDRPVPMIIDFGVAKATEQRLTERTVFTQLGTLIGTPEYMSPEQAEMTGLDVDTRTDVYSLGVMLYELLTGVLPFDSQELRAAGYDEIRRRIREEEPSKPSTRLGTLERVSTESAKLRQSDPTSLLRQLRGDLDWITMRALEKDRTRRYGSPSDLANDVQRHLNDEPVVAGPPSTAYVVGKFVRRHRIAVAAAGVVLAALVLGLSGTTYGLARAMRAEEQARQEAATAEQVSEFLVGLFEVSDPGEALGNTITAREILDRGAEEAGRELESQPEVRGRFLDTMGRVYGNLGLYQDSARLLEQAVDLREQALGDDALEVAWSLHNLAAIYRHQGEYERAERSIRRAAEIKEASVGPDDPDLAVTLTELAALHADQFEFDLSEPYYLRAIEIYEANPDGDGSALALALNNLANSYQEQSQYGKAETLFKRSLEIYESDFGPNHPKVAMALANLALLYNRQARYDEAEATLKRSLEIKEKVLGPDHVEVAGSLGNLAITYAEQNRLEEAEEIMRRTLSIREKALGPDHLTVGWGYNDLGIICHRRHDLAGAETAFRRALTVKEGALGPDSPDVAATLTNLAALYQEQGRNEESEAYYRRALAIQRENPGLAHPQTGLTIHNLANLYRSQEKYDEAEPMFEQALEIWESALGPEHPSIAMGLNNLAGLYIKTGRQEEAENLFARALAIREKVFGPKHPAVAGIFYNRACLAALQRDNKKALDLLREASDRGYAEPRIAEDPDLASLHGNPEFEAIVAQIRKRIEVE